MIHTLSKKIYIVIDALDELEEEDRRKLWRVIIRLTDSFSSSVNVMVTSRTNTYLADDLTDIRKIEIRTENDDILMYVKARLTSGHLARILEPDPELKSHILHIIPAKSNGMYV